MSRVGLANVYRLGWSGSLLQRGDGSLRGFGLLRQRLGHGYAGRDLQKCDHRSLAREGADSYGP
jgi:hypothetical protein